MNSPLAKPIRSLPAYSPPIDVVAIMITLETQQSALANQIDILRPIICATGPAVEELAKAPSVMSDDMSCWRSVAMFHPRGVLAG